MSRRGAAKLVSKLEGAVLRVKKGAVIPPVTDLSRVKAKRISLRGARGLAVRLAKQVLQNGEVEQLDLSRTTLSDGALPMLTSPSLRLLDVRQTDISLKQALRYAIANPRVDLKFTTHEIDLTGWEGPLPAIELIARFAPNANVLTLDGTSVTDAQLIAFSKQWPRLRWVSLADTSLSAEGVSALPQSVITLDLSRTSMHAPALNFPCLMSLTLSGCAWVDSELLDRWADRLPTLEQLDISHCANFFLDDLLLEGRGFKSDAQAVIDRLEHPILQRVNLTGIATAKTALTFCFLAGITKLDCSHSRFDDEAYQTLADFPDYVGYLREIVLSGCRGITQLAPLPALETVWLDGTDVEVDEIEELVSGCPTLKTIHLNGDHPYQPPKGRRPSVVWHEV